MTLKSLLPTSFAAFAWLILSPFAAHADTRPLVLELFTSQGCSSCPPAEELLTTLNNPDTLALSFHVKYWDYLGWQDPFASEENTLRQRTYSQILRDALYTPQLVIDGAKIATATDPAAIETTMRSTRTNLPAIPITLTGANDILRVTVAAAPATSGKDIPLIATLWAMQYKKKEITDVTAGENKGKKLTSLHPVIKITKLGTWQRDAVTYPMPVNKLGDDGIAFILQSESYGRIIGVKTYNDN